jgi:uncharacterized paraquat-inducible protein A
MLERLRAMMTDRNGLDKLSIALIVLALVINAFSQFFPLLILFSLIVMIYAVWRVFSKSLAKRRAENYRFIHILGDIKDSYAKWRFRRQQSKQYRFFSCPGCKCKLRVPRGKGKISITCPRCGLKFSKKS